MSYVDYAFYAGDFHGTAIALDDFQRLAMRASVAMDRLTFGRAAAVMALEGEVGADTATITKIKLATCAVADEIQSLDQSGGVVQSESVGSVSVTYAFPGSERKRLVKSAADYLWDTNLMYPGFLAGEL